MPEMTYRQKWSVVIIINYNESNRRNNFSISTDGLASALQRSAAALVTQGNSIDEAVALITAGNAINQDPEKVGNGLRTIALRMAGTEEAKKELEESGEEVTDYIIDGVVGTKSKIDAQLREFTAVASNNYEGVSMVDARGNYKDTYEVMQDIADIYDEIEATDKKFGTNHLQALLELLAGKNRANIAASILQNGEMLRDVYEQSQDSEGSAMEENEKYLNSLEGKMQKIKNNLQDLAFSLLNSDLLKAGLDVVNGLLDGVNAVIDAIGGIPVAMGAAFGAFKFVDWLKGNSKKAIMQEQDKYIKGIFDAITGQESDASLKDTVAEEGLAESKTAVATASTGESAAITESIATKNAEVAANEALAQSERDLANAKNGETASDMAEDIPDVIDDVIDSTEPPKKEFPKKKDRKGKRLKRKQGNIGNEIADEIGDNIPDKIDTPKIDVEPDLDIDTSKITDTMGDVADEASDAGKKALGETMKEIGGEVAGEAGGEVLGDALGDAIKKAAKKGMGDTGAKAIEEGTKNVIKNGFMSGADAGVEAAAGSGIFTKIATKISTLMATATGPLIAVALASVAGIAGLAIVNHNITKAFDDKFEKFTNSSADYSKTVQDLDNIDSKLKETQENIRQIEELPNKSITDEADLARLERENVALERQKALLEAQEKTQKKQQHDDAITALNSKQVVSSVKSASTWNSGAAKVEKTNRRGTLTSVAREEVNDWIELQDKIAQKQDEYTKKQDEFSKLSKKEQKSSRGTALKKEIDDTKKEIDDYQKTFKEVDDGINTHLSQLQELQAGLDTTTSEGLKQYNTIEGIIKDYNEYGLSSEEKAVSALDSFFGKSADENVASIGKELKQSIIDQLSSGEAKTAQEALMNLGLTLKDIGSDVDASELEDYFGKISAGAKQAEESVKGVDGSFTGVKSAFEKANQGADYDEMVNFLKTAKELREEGQIGTDDFQTVAQWMSPKEIEGGAKAYKKAYDKYIKKVNDWFGATDKDGNIDTKKGMTNFADALVGAGKATKKGGLDTLKLNFDNTAEAAKKLGVGVNVVDTALHKLEEYGVDLGKVNFSSEMLNEYSDSLDALKNTYNTMSEGEAKDSLGEKIFGSSEKGIKGFQKELEECQGDLSKLTEEKIVKIKLQVEDAELTSEIEELRAGGRSLTKEERGAVISKEVSLRGNREKSTGINRKNNKDYGSSYEQIEQLHGLMNDPKATSKQIEQYQKYEDAIVHLQNTWLDMKEQGSKMDWAEFLRSKDAQAELDGLDSLTKKGMQKVLDTLTDESNKATSKANQARAAFSQKSSEYRWSHQDEAKGIVEELKSEGYESAGINVRGKAVRNVEESNKRIKKSTENLFKELSKGKDVYGELEKEAKKQGYVTDKQSSAVEKLAGKYKGGTKALEKYNKTLKESNKKGKEASKTGGKEQANEKGTTKTNKEVVEKTTKELTEKTTKETKEVDFEVDTSQIENIEDDLGLDETMQKVVEIVGEDKATPILELWNALKPQPKFASLSAKDQATYVIDIWNGLSPEEKKAIINGVDNASAIIEKIINKTIPVKNVVIKALDYASSIIGAIANKLSSLDGKTATTTIKTRKVTEVTTVNGKVPGRNNHGAQQLYGTARKSGTAYAKGTLSDEQVDSVIRSDSWKTNKTENALTGEVGQELVVTGNKWFTVGDRGAEFARIPKGAIVFNAEQTEQLFKKGYINSRGTSNGKVKYPSSSASFAKGTAYKKGSKKKGSSTLADKLSSYTSQLFDWAELRLKRLTNLTEKYNKIASKATKLNEKQYKTTLATYKVNGKTRSVQSTGMGMQEAINAAINATRNEIIGSDKAAQKYLSTANKVAKKGKLSASLKKQIQDSTLNGSFSIVHYKKATKNKATLEAIQAYNTWYEKYLDTQNSIAELESKMRKFYQERLDNIKNWYTSIESMNKAWNDRDEAIRKYNNTIGSADALSEDLYKNSISRASTNVANAKKAFDEYAAEINRQVNSGIMRENDSTWISAQTELAKLSQQYYDSQQALADLNDAVRSLSFDKLKNNIDVLSTSVGKLSSQLDAMKTYGWRSSFGYTQEEQLANARMQLNKDKEQLPLWETYRNEALSDMSKYAFGTEAWKKAKERFDDANSSILDITSSVLDLISSIREVRWKAFEDGIAILDETSEELENIKDLLNEDYYNDENGNLTKDGLANIALLAKLMENAQRKVLAYNQALVDLEDDYKNGNLSEEEYIETKRDYIKATQEQTKSEQEYMKEIVSAYTQHIEEQNDALQENIKKRKEALDRVKDYYDYQRTISEKSKDINYLQQQIKALEGVSNKAGEAKLASLRDQLAEAQLDMNDTVYEHEYSLRTQGYDDILDSLDKALDTINKKIAQSTEYQKQIVDEALGLVRENSTDISEYIKGVLGTAGAQMSEDTKTVVSNIGVTDTALTNLGTSITDLSTKTSGLVTSLTGIKDIDTSPIDTAIEGLKKFIGIAGDISNDTNQKKNVDNTNTNNTNGNTNNSNTGSSGSNNNKQTNTVGPSMPNNGKNKGFISLPNSVKGVSTTVSAPSLKNPPQLTEAQKKEREAQLKKEYNLLATNFIISNGKKGDKNAYKKGKYGDFNTALYKKNGLILSADKRKQLAKKLGVSYDNDKTTGKLYKKLKDIGYFAKGSKDIIKDMLGITQEQGQEIIYRKSDGAMLTPLGKGDKVFTAQMTDNLWKLAQKASLKDNGFSSLSAPIINNVSTTSPVININFENFMTVEGNVDKEAITDIKKFKAEMVDEFTKTMTNEMNLLGHKFRF